MTILSPKAYPILLLSILCIACGKNGLEHPLKSKDYHLVFEDNFDEIQLDTTKWQIYSNNPKPFDKVLPRANCDFSTAEMLSKENVQVQDGNLKIIASNTKYQYSGIAGGKCNEKIGCGFIGCDSFHLDLKYASGSIFAKKGYNHGYFECRAKMPSTKGLYPVFWLWHHDEIVVFEFFGNPKDHYLSVHNKDKFTSEKFNEVEDYSKAFHIYAVEWTPYSITWFFDNKPLRTDYKYLDKNTGKGITKEHYQANNDYVLNNSFPDSKDRWLCPNISLRVYEWSDYIADSSLPDQLLIDYIKVYQND